MKPTLKVLIIALIGLFLFPVNVFAVEFSINETSIDAYIQEDGEVFVEEVYTYAFEGDFNGITRTLIPKKGSSITDFKATENGAPLEVEKDGEEYRIYREGDNETITIELSYSIQDGVTMYDDMTEFHWPFFDSGNESDYENLTITIHPPERTDDVIALGYDEAYGTEKVQDDGTVLFELGFTDSGKNGDIRVAFENGIFANVSVTEEGMIREELLQEKEHLAEKEAAFLERQGILTTVAPYVTGAFGFFLLLLLFYAWRHRRMTMLEAERMHHSSTIIPHQMMSTPATIFYSRHQSVDYGELLTIGMMDLVRQGKVRVLDDESYELISSKTKYSHERTLINLLFETIGKDHIFSFDQLEKYTEDEKNQETFHAKLVKYRQGLVDEIKSHNLHENKKKLRYFTGYTSLLLIPSMIIFGMHELFMWVFFQMVILVGLLAFALFYKPKTVEGLLVGMEWKSFKDEFSEMKRDDWATLQNEEQARALLFAAGSSDKKLLEKGKSLIKQDTFTSPEASNQLLTLLLLSSTASVSFGSATTTSAASGGVSTSVGTGVGGGGGGSGAF